MGIVNEISANGSSPETIAGRIYGGYNYEDVNGDLFVGTTSVASGRFVSRDASNVIATTIAATVPGSVEGAIGVTIAGVGTSGSILFDNTYAAGSRCSVLTKGKIYVTSDITNPPLVGSAAVYVNPTTGVITSLATGNILLSGVKVLQDSSSTRTFNNNIVSAGLVLVELNSSTLTYT